MGNVSKKKIFEKSDPLQIVLKRDIILTLVTQIKAENLGV